MDLETRTTLWNRGVKIAEQGDTIKIFLENEEIIIGEYDYSDLCYLKICRNEKLWEFDLDDIENIIVLNN